MTNAKRSPKKGRKQAKSGVKSPSFAGVPGHLTQAELERVTGLSRQTLAELAREPDCPREKRGGRWVYPWPAWNEWRINRRVDRAVERAKPENYDAAKTRKMAADAELAELELARERGHLITLVDATKIADDAFDRVRARLVSIPGKEAYRFVGLKAIPKAVTALRDVIDVVMAELSGEPEEEAA